MLTQVKLGYGHVKNVETCDLERWPTHYQGGMLDLQPRFVSRYRVMWIRLSRWSYGQKEITSASFQRNSASVKPLVLIGQFPQTPVTATLN